MKINENKVFKNCQMCHLIRFPLLVIFDDGVDPVGHGEDGDLPELAVHQAGDPRVRVHIHRGGRLVQNQQLRVSL